MSSFSIKSSNPFVASGKQEQKTDNKSYFDSSKPSNITSTSTSSTPSTYGNGNSNITNKSATVPGFSIKHNIYAQEDFY